MVNVVLGTNRAPSSPPRRASARPDAPLPRAGRRIGGLELPAEAHPFVELLIDWEEERTLRAVSSAWCEKGTEPGGIGRNAPLYPIRSTSPLPSWPSACH